MTKRLLLGVILMAVCCVLFTGRVNATATKTVSGQLIDVGSSALPTSMTILSNGKYYTVSVPAGTTLQKTSGGAMTLAEFMVNDMVEVTYATSTKVASKVRDVSWDGAAVRASGIVQAVNCKKSAVTLKVGSVLKNVTVIASDISIIRTNRPVSCNDLLVGDSAVVFGAGSPTISASRIVITSASITGAITKVTIAAAGTSATLTVKTAAGTISIRTTSATQYLAKNNHLGNLSMLKVGHMVSIRAGKSGSVYTASKVVDPSANPGPAAIVGSLQFPKKFAASSAGLLRAQSISVTGGTTVKGWAQSLAVVGDYVYIVGTGGGLQVVDMTKKYDPRIVGSVALDGSEVVVAVRGTYAYIGTTNGLYVIDVTDPTKPVKAGFVSFQRHADSGSAHFYGNSDLIPPYSIAVSGTTVVEYGVMLNETVALFDVADPTAPKLASTLDTVGLIWNSTVAVNGNLLYIQGQDATVNTMDISNPYKPEHLTKTMTFCGMKVGMYVPLTVFSGSRLFCTMYLGLYGSTTSDNGLTYSQVSTLLTPSVGMPFAAMTISGNRIFGITKRDDSKGLRPSVAEVDVTNPKSSKLKTTFTSPEFYLKAANPEDGEALISAIAASGKYAIVLRPAELISGPPNWVQTVRTPAKLFIVQFDD